MARILLIDDDESVRTVIQLTLAHFGHTVVEAHHGRAGLELFQQSAFDLVITDIVMPEKEGIEVLMELRKAVPPVKIIAISGGGRGGATDYLQLARHLGAAKTVAKPFTGEELMAAVNGLLAEPPVTSG